MPQPAGYSRLQIVLHWIVALLILQQYLFKGAIADAWDAIGKGAESAFNPLVLAHVAGGAAILVAALWRLTLNARRGVPALIGNNVLLNAAAKVTHLGLYALLILMPLSGAAAWFGGVQTAAAVHNLLKVLLLALIALHILGAFYHQIVLKDGVMARMKRAGG